MLQNIHEALNGPSILAFYQIVTSRVLNQISKFNHITLGVLGVLYSRWFYFFVSLIITSKTTVSNFQFVMYLQNKNLTREKRFYLIFKTYV